MWRLWWGMWRRSVDGGCGVLHCAGGFELVERPTLPMSVRSPYAGHTSPPDWQPRALHPLSLPRAPAPPSSPAAATATARGGVAMALVVLGHSKGRRFWIWRGPGRPAVDSAAPQ
jgi:hypothetical protein